MLRFAPGSTLSKEINNLFEKCSAVAPNFIFKSLSRNYHKEDTTVTLLEENEIIGHGTTGMDFIKIRNVIILPHQNWFDWIYYYLRIRLADH